MFDHLCNNGITVMEVTKCFLIGFKAHSRGVYNCKPGQNHGGKDDRPYRGTEYCWLAKLT